MMRTVRTALARLRSKAQKPASGASETGAQPSETPEVRRSQGTDRAVFSTAQGWIAGDAIFDADLVDQVFFGKSYLVPVEITIGPQRLLLRWIDEAPGERPLQLGRPTSIELADITGWGAEGRYLGIQWGVDGSRYRFVLRDDAAARRADDRITQSITAAGMGHSDNPGGGDGSIQSDPTILEIEKPTTRTLDSE
jgi:hypothetical protein